MKSRHWIVPSLAAALGGIGYGVAQNMSSAQMANTTPAAPAVRESLAQAETPGTSDRVSLSYRRKGDENFAEVKVATVEPFGGASAVEHHIAARIAATSEAHIAGETALASKGSDHPAQNGASAFLRKVAAAGDAAASGDQTDAAPAQAPAFETTRLSSRLIDNDEPAWQSRFFADNPLVGGIFQGDGNRSDAQRLIGAAKSARYVLLGETHDNPDHHRLQSDIVSDLADQSTDLALVFEMIPHRLGDAVASFGTSRSSSIDLDSMADRLEWSDRGWPEFSMYRPLFETAKRQGLSVEAGDLDRDVVSAIARNGVSGLSAEERARLSLDGAADPAMIADLGEEVRSAHCGLMPEAAIMPMVDAQRARDGSLAAAMVDAAKTGDKAVLIAGAGHVRDDRGVPSIIKRNDPEAQTLSVRMMEVADEDGDLADYGLTAEAPAPYDFTIFTPRADVDDPCEALRARLKGKAGTASE
ncbi:ChaN family lipoprotein [Jiella mangrovi]|uniref:ChaN family lipoprotein n=1 Tax=Jiella mangrovi TaxID=2821407 RepID=A0ABS4BEI9_9HYPH|nr:ChaN family lipoprotein [Jiella mangrovi]MBP0615163.1 ChaN family lipoprotein [Jiella mangrovi]